MREQIKVHVEVLDKDVLLPFYANKTDAGMDIRANEDIAIQPQQTVVIKTGLKFAIPEGFEIQVRARSGLSLNTPLRVSNGVGTIDSGYRGELGIIMTNTSRSDTWDEQYTLNTKGNLPGTYHINKGDRVAQIVLQRVPEINFIQVNNVADIGDDRNGGFGSTGV